MPIYAYRCTSCGHAKDVLQKLSEPSLSVCPACGASTFAKQVTAAGFQLKGSGWYATDFKNNGTVGKKAGDESSSGDGKAGEGKPAEKTKTESTADSAAKPDSGASPAPSKPASTEPKAAAAGGAPT